MEDGYRTYGAYSSHRPLNRDCVWVKSPSPVRKKLCRSTAPVARDRADASSTARQINDAEISLAFVDNPTIHRPQSTLSPTRRTDRRPQLSAQRADAAKLAGEAGHRRRGRAGAGDTSAATTYRRNWRSTSSTACCTCAATTITTTTTAAPCASVNDITSRFYHFPTSPSEVGSRQWPASKRPPSFSRRRTGANQVESPRFGRANSARCAPGQGWSTPQIGVR